MSRPLDLMRIYDGEHTEDELAELAELAPEDERVLEGIEQLGDVLRAHADARSEGIDIADSVMARLDEPEADTETETETEAKREPVVAKLPSRKAPPPKTKVAPVVAIGLALAAAAAWALWPKPGVDTTTRPAPIAKTAEPAPSEQPEPIAQVEVVDEDGLPAASIEAVDFGNHAGTIFMVPAGEESTPVVWLEDEPAGGRMERL